MGNKGKNEKTARFLVFRTGGRAVPFHESRITGRSQVELNGAQKIQGWQMPLFFNILLVMSEYIQKVMSSGQFSLYISSLGAESVLT